MIKAVIFDFDDTLCLTEQAVYELESHVLRQMGKPPIDRVFFRETWGKPLYESFRLRYPDIPLDKLLDKISAAKDEFVKEGKFDNVPAENLEALDALTKDGKQLMILTSRDGSGVEHLIDPEHHVGSRVSAVYHIDNNPYHKPDPRTFDVLEKYHELKPEECIYVGDSIGDAAAAKGAGLHFIASLESGLKTREDFSEYTVDEFITHFPQVVGAVRLIEARIK